MKKYLWNVRVKRVKHDYIEIIMEATTAEEAEVLVQETEDIYELVADDKALILDEQPDVFIDEQYTERMDRLFPNEYSNPDEEGTMQLTNYEYGFLMASSQYVYSEYKIYPEDDWQEIKVDYKYYDLHFYREEDNSGTACVAYATKPNNTANIRDSESCRTTDLNVFRKLW